MGLHKAFSEIKIYFLTGQTDLLYHMGCTLTVRNSHQDMSDDILSVYICRNCLERLISQVSCVSVNSHLWLWGIWSLLAIALQMPQAHHGGGGGEGRGSSAVTKALQWAHGLVQMSPQNWGIGIGSECWWDCLGGWETKTFHGIYKSPLHFLDCSQFSPDFHTIFKLSHIQPYLVIIITIITIF